MNIILVWLYYSKIPLVGSIVITLLLNKCTSKLYIPPLIINMVSVILLYLSRNSKNSNSVYLIYLPIVVASILTNLSIWLIKKYSK